MVNDISGFGTKVTLQSVPTFPAGITVTQFADDADSLDSPNQTIGEAAMGVNGDMVFWSKAIVNPIELNVIPDSLDDQNLATLFALNKVGKGKISAQDLIQIVITYPNGATATFINGKITEGPATSSVANSGRKKTKKYMFKFENYVTTPAVL